LRPAFFRGDVFLFHQRKQDEPDWPIRNSKARERRQIIVSSQIRAKNAAVTDRRYSDSNTS
jgi:hypothetical protein